jgi:predicted PurR-regulated permease PerM
VNFTKDLVNVLNFKIGISGLFINLLLQCCVSYMLYDMRSFQKLFQNYNERRFRDVGKRVIL